MGLSQPVRTRLAELFNLIPTGESVVHVGQMIGGNIAGVAKSDGFTPHDLQAVTTQRLQEVLKSKDTDFYKLFNALVEKLDDITELPPPEPIKIQVPVTEDNPSGFVQRPYEDLIKPKTGTNGKKTKSKSK